MRAYWSFFKIRFLTGIQYRTAAIAGIVTQLCWGFMYIMLYNSFYKSNPSSLPMDISQLRSYIWLQQSFLTLLMMWILDEDIFEQISSGNVAYEISRPLDIYNMWFVKNTANRVSKALLRSIPIIIISLLLPNAYKLDLPGSTFSAILFLISIILGLLVAVSYSMLIYIFTFYTVSSVGVKIVMVMIADFFSGSIIPLPLLPDNLAKVLYLFPFASIQNTPFRIYSGVLTNIESIKFILLQCSWIFILVVLGRIFMKNALKKVVVQGG